MEVSERNKIIEERANDIARFEYLGYEVPGHMLYGLAKYIEFGEPGGGFLMSVLKGDLFGALNSADNSNLKSLPAYGAYLYNNVPAGSYGSPDAVKAWIEKGGIRGREG